MKEIELIIGRNGDFNVDNEYVSRRHARLIRKADGSLFIEDLDSTGGTFVNDKRVKLKMITYKDIIRLGDSYILNVRKILDQLPLSDEEYTEKILELKDIFERYEKAKVRIQSKGQFKTILKRSLPMIVSGLVIGVLPLLMGNNISTRLRSISVIAGALLTASTIAVGSFWAAKENSKMPEKLSELGNQFQEDYICPSCKRDFGIKPWRVIVKMGRCPYCKREFNLDYIFDKKA